MFAKVRKVLYEDSITETFSDLARVYREGMDLSQPIPAALVLCDVMTALGLPEADIKSILGADYALIDSPQPADFVAA